MILRFVRSSAIAKNSPNDTPASLHARIQLAERELYPQVIAQFGREMAAATL